MNGTYHVHRELFSKVSHHNRVLFSKEGDETSLLWYSEDEQWRVSNKSSGWAHCVETGLRSPAEAATWNVWTGETWKYQPEVTCVYLNAAAVARLIKARNEEWEGGGDTYQPQAPCRPPSRHMLSEGQSEEDAKSERNRKRKWESNDKNTAASGTRSERREGEDEREVGKREGGQKREEK